MLTRYTQRLLITGWVILALFLMSDLANAEYGGDFPTIITQQGVFTIIETPNATRICTRQGAFVICN